MIIIFYTKITLVILHCNVSHALYIKGVFRNCNLFINRVKNNICYDTKIESNVM